MSKWMIDDEDPRLFHDGNAFYMLSTPEQTARIVALLQEGEADKRRLDHVERKGLLGAVLWRGVSDLGWLFIGQTTTHRTAREALNAAIASESEPAGEGI